MDVSLSQLRIHITTILPRMEKHYEIKNNFLGGHYYFHSHSWDMYSPPWQMFPHTDNSSYNYLIRLIIPYTHEHHVTDLFIKSHMTIHIVFLVIKSVSKYCCGCLKSTLSWVLIFLILPGQTNHICIQLKKTIT